MTTPFGGAKTPLLIDLLPINKGNAGLDANANSVGLTLASTTLSTGVGLDWSKLSGTFTFNVVFSHDTGKTSGDQMVRLVDITNSSTVLATASSNASVNATDFARAIATSIVFTKPTTFAKIGMACDSVSSAGIGVVTFKIYSAYIMVT